MGAAIRQTFARGAFALPEPMRPQQVVKLLNRLGHPTTTRWHAEHGALSARGGRQRIWPAPCGVVPKNARLVAWDGARHLHLSRARRALRQRMTLPVADFLQRLLLPVPGPHTRVRSYGLSPHAHPETLAHCRTASTAGGAPTCPGLADRVCPTGRRASGTVSHLRSAPVCTGVIPRGGHPAPVGEGARGMTPAPQETAGQGWGVPGACRVGTPRGPGGR